jgi:hypothetical protein
MKNGDPFGARSFDPALHQSLALSRSRSCAFSLTHGVRAGYELGWRPRAEGRDADAGHDRKPRQEHVRAAFYPGLADIRQADWPFMLNKPFNFGAGTSFGLTTSVRPNTFGHLVIPAISQTVLVLLARY